MRAGHHDQADDRGHGQREAGEFRIAEHFVGEQGGEHGDWREAAHHHGFAHIGAERQHEPCADGGQQAEWQSQADDLQQLHHIVTAGGQVHQHADHQHGDERVGVGERLNERGHDGGDLHIGKHEHDHDQVGVERDGAEEAFRHVA